MNRLRVYTVKNNPNKRIPLQTQSNEEPRTAMNNSASRRKHLNIVTQDIIEEYLKKLNLDMNDENDSEVIIKLLQKPSKNSKDIEIIMKVFNNITFFQDLQKKIPPAHIFHLIKEFKYEFKEKGDVVFRFDELGINYYILLKGSLYLLLPKSTLNKDYTPEKQYVASTYLTEPPTIIQNVMKTQINEEKNIRVSSPDGKNTPKIEKNINYLTTVTPKNLIITPKNNLITQKNTFVSPSFQRKFSKFSEDLMRKKTVISENILKDPEVELMNTIRKTFPDFEITKKLEAVTGFGEIALMSNLKRTATLVCRENCHLVTLSKPNYEKILKEHYDSIVQSKINFMKNYSFFAEWNTSKMLSLWELLKLHTFSRNHVIYKEGDLSTSFFFVKEGEIEISKLYDISNENDKTSFKDNESKEIDLSVLEDLNLVWADRKWRRKVKRIKLALLGPGTFFGEEEVLLHIPRATKAVVVSSQAQVYKCPNEKFFAYVKTLHNLQLLKDDIQRKNEWREELLSSIKAVNEFLKSESSLESKEFNPTRLFQTHRSSSFSPINKPTYRKQRIASLSDQKPQLDSLLYLEKMHRRLSNILKLKRTLYMKNDREQCIENSRFLNSLLEENNKKMCIVKKSLPGSQIKLIGVLKEIFPVNKTTRDRPQTTQRQTTKRSKKERNSSVVVLPEEIQKEKPINSRKEITKKARSLSLKVTTLALDSSFHNKTKEKAEKKRFFKGRVLKKRFKAKKLFDFDEI